jgi:hypothetical protein
MEGIMAKHKAPQPTQQRIHFTDMEDMPATYADMFMVIAEKETSMFEIYFFHSQVSIPNMAYGTAMLGGRQTAKCVSRIVLSEKGLGVLSKALEDNRAALTNIQGEDKE